METNRRQRRGFETDEISHFRGKPRWRFGNAGEQIRIIKFCGDVLIGAGCRDQRSRGKEAATIRDVGKADGIESSDTNVGNANC